ncbi:hypothetical protein INR49_008140, partial [Caranx melampygus]
PELKRVLVDRQEVRRSPRLDRDTTVHKAAILSLGDAPLSTSGIGNDQSATWRLQVHCDKHYKNPPTVAT